MPPDNEDFTRAVHLSGSMFHERTHANASNSPYLPLSTQDPSLQSQAESSFTDGSDVLFSLYNDKAAEYDIKLAENWREDAQGVMLLSGLLSATVAGFLSQSYLSSQTSPQDVSAFYLGQIYQQQASSNASEVQSPPVPPKPASTPNATHAFWFASLVLSLASAVFATLVQEWVRRYLLLTQPRLSPHRRARIRACLMQEGSLVDLQRMVNSLHTFLHLSIFFFLIGLITLTSSGNIVVVVAVNLYIAVPLVLYLRYSLMPYFHPQSLYSTPLSGFLLSLRVIPRLFLSRFMTITRRGSSRGTTRDPYIHTDGGWLMLDHAILEVERLAESRSSMLDGGAVSWLLGALGQDHELEQFLAAIPGFYRSKRVESPAEVLRALNTNRLPKLILSFMDRSLSSELVSDIAGQKRIRLSLKAMESDPYLLQRTFYHALCSVDSAVFKCVDFVLLADRFTQDDDPDICFLARCIVAVAISRLEDYESHDRWTSVVQRGLDWSQSLLSEYSGQRDSIRLRNLVQIARELSSAHPDYDDPAARTIFRNTLDAAMQLDVRCVSHQHRREFCELWNQLVASMQDLRRDPVIRSNAMRILSLTSTLYVPLHEDTDSRCFAFLSASSDDLSPAPRNAAPYPLCAVPTHRQPPPPPPEGSIIVAFGDPETYPDDSEFPDASTDIAHSQWHVMP